MSMDWRRWSRCLLLPAISLAAVGCGEDEPDDELEVCVPNQSSSVSAAPRGTQVAAHARSEPWIDPDDRQTHGPNVIAFFNSLIDDSGRLVDLFDEEGRDTPEYGPLPDDVGHDFFAGASGDRFSFPYKSDGAFTRREYFQGGAIGEPAQPPDKQDVALNAKIVQAFYATNWLHDFFYAAGFDEAAGNAQRRNHGRGGIECDPLIVHSGFYGTFAYPPADGTSPVLHLGGHPRSSSLRDTSMDFSITAHEWGHYLISRLAGTTVETDAMGNLQGQSMHEGEHIKGGFKRWRQDCPSHGAERSVG